MEPEATRRTFLRGGSAATAGLLPAKLHEFHELARGQAEAPTDEGCKVPEADEEILAR